MNLRTIFLIGLYDELSKYAQKTNLKLVYRRDYFTISDKEQKIKADILFRNGKLEIFFYCYGPAFDPVLEDNPTQPEYPTNRCMQVSFCIADPQFSVERFIRQLCDIIIEGPSYFRRSPS